VVFTVDEEEERKRAKRAQRFAARSKASFELEEKESQSIEPAPLSNTAVDSAKTASAPEAAVESGGPVQLPLPPMPPIGMLPDADGMVAMSEEQIADYLLEMEQQFMSSIMPMEGQLHQEGDLPTLTELPPFMMPVETAAASESRIPDAPTASASPNPGAAVGAPLEVPAAQAEPPELAAAVTEAISSEI
jgi:hypothetical protein